MAEFNIQRQHAQIIQQAEVINVGTADWNEATERLRALTHNVKGLIDAGQLDPRSGGELRAVISEAAAAKEKQSRLRALTKASTIAAGVSILSGISDTIGQIMQMMPR